MTWCAIGGAGDAHEPSGSKSNVADMALITAKRTAQCTSMCTVQYHTLPRYDSWSKADLLGRNSKAGLECAGNLNTVTIDYLSLWFSRLPALSSEWRKGWPGRDVPAPRIWVADGFSRVMIDKSAAVKDAAGCA